MIETIKGKANRQLEHERFVEQGQRLEYLGDAVASLLVREMLIFRFPEIPKVKYSHICAVLVSNAEMNMMAQATGINAAEGDHAWKGRARAFEEHLGMLYLDHGLEEARNFLIPLLLGRFDIRQMAAEWNRTESSIAVYKEGQDASKTESESPAGAEAAGGAGGTV